MWQASSVVHQYICPSSKRVASNAFRGKITPAIYFRQGTLPQCLLPEFFAIAVDDSRWLLPCLFPPPSPITSLGY